MLFILVFSIYIKVSLKMQLQYIFMHSYGPNIV